MSKQSPSIGYWTRRVFRNSYTRGGRLLRVRGWSVKIQHQGRRHTVSLGAGPRIEAARRARALFRAILTRGWDAAIAQSRPRIAPAPPAAVRDQARYWSRRLLVRRYTEGLRPAHPGEFSARIEHDGEGHYFALGTATRTDAARRAATIYRTILTAGWSAARERFPRELTVAVLWAMDPLACTYGTLVTTPEGNPDGLSRRTEPTREGVVWIVEADPGVGRTLASCVERHPPGLTVAILAAAEEALRLTSDVRPALVLLNRDLPGIGASACAEGLRTRHPDLPVFTYGTYSDSDRLFLSFGGVRAGYILRRRPPGLLLEPLGLPLAPTMRMVQVSQRIRRYFQSLFDAPAGDETRTMAQLTPREQEILEALSKGYVDKEIAQRLGISAWTVHGHLRSIFDKLQVHTRTEAAVRYLQK